LFALAALALVSQAHAQIAVPVHEEPRHHLVHDRDGIRILDVQIASGDTTLYHIHDAAILYVTISASATDAQRLGGSWGGTLPTSTSMWALGNVATNLRYVQRPVTHRVTAVGPDLFRLIAVVNYERESRPAVSMPGETVTDNEWFFATRLTLEPGETTVPFTAVAPLVIVQVNKGQARTKIGEVDSGMSSPGQWIVVENGKEVRLGNAGSSTVTMVLVRTY
jgi:quercetin dioxygenase-like cupin family protein